MNASDMNAEMMEREAALNLAAAALAGDTTNTYTQGGVLNEGGRQHHHQHHHQHHPAAAAAAAAAAQFHGFAEQNNTDFTANLRQFQQQQAALDLQRLAAAQVAEANITLQSRPEEHFLTVSTNGIILGATETVTGFPPNALLMTSAYESVHPEDLLGLRAVSSRYWDKGVSDVMVYFRRRTVEDDWIWLVAQVVQYLQVPVSGVVIHERLAKDEKFAQVASKLCRLEALLSFAVEKARLRKSKGEVSESEMKNSHENKDGSMTGETLPPELSAVMGGSVDAKMMSALLNNGATGRKSPDTQENSGVGGADNSSGASDSTNNPLFSVMTLVKGHTCLDFSKIILSSSEARLVSLVLNGYIQPEELSPMLQKALRVPHVNLADAITAFVQSFDARETAAIATAPRGTHGSAVLGHAPSQAQATVGASHHHGVRGASTVPLPSRTRHHKRVSSRSGNLPVSPTSVPLHQPLSCPPPPICALNFSYTNIGNCGMESLSDVLYSGSPYLKCLDIGFCGVDERGMLALCRGLKQRKQNALPPLQGLILSGNVVTYKVAKELGVALSSAGEKRLSRQRSKVGRDIRRRALGRDGEGTGYDEDDEWDDDDEEEYDDILFGGSNGRPSAPSNNNAGSTTSGKPQKKGGLLLLHLACTSLKPDSLYQLLLGLGQDCPIRELSIPSNDLGPDGSALLVAFLEGKGMTKYKKGHPVMPKLDRLDMSNNKLGNAGTSKLTRAISKRINVNFVDLRLSSNDIGASGIETIMNKLLQHNLLSLSLDNNTIGDRGCQLVAASLPSMHQLSRLSLSFNQIGSRGVNTLMRALVGCESIMYLGLSGNVMKISGSIAMGFALSQHPRLAELEVENCCLSQVSQCHIVAGIISNRWVPMKSLNGFRVGPPMVAIGALDLAAQNLDNEECFRIRRDIQMKTILQWMESGRATQQGGSAEGKDNYFTSDMMTGTEVNGMPSQSAYLRMLDWLSRIPFDEDELASLRSYFYDADGGDNERTSDGNINLRLRGDLLAALGSDVVDEIRVDPIYLPTDDSPPVGLNISDSDDEADENDETDAGHELWQSVQRCDLTAGDTTEAMDQDGFEKTGRSLPPLDRIVENANEAMGADHGDASIDEDFGDGGSEGPPSCSGKKRRKPAELEQAGGNMAESGDGERLASDSSNSLTSHAESEKSNMSGGASVGRNSKARISMFRPFAEKLEMLKAHAQTMMDQEPDPLQQDIIAQQFAEASLTLLRQLRYHCMDSGLDGWRQGKLRRKVLIVDDSVVTRKMVSRAFQKANFIVDMAENGKEGVAKLKESIYDIAFMDIDMPIMNGFDATKALREWEDAMRPGARQPICALTAAYVDDFELSELMKFKEAGLDVFESKPCNIPRLFKVVDDVSPMFSDLSISVTQNMATT